MVADVLRHVPVALEAAGPVQVRPQDRRTGKIEFSHLGLILVLYSLPFLDKIKQKLCKTKVNIIEIG